MAWSALSHSRYGAVPFSAPIADMTNKQMGLKNASQKYVQVNVERLKAMRKQLNLAAAVLVPGGVSTSQSDDAD